MTGLSRTMGVALLLGLTSCTWVDVQPGAEAITVKTLAQVTACKRLGTATAQTKDRITFYQRDSAKIASELLTLARNEALSLNGDTLVVLGDPEEGIQRFGVYRCDGQ